jgi:membrane protease YdiL (CAAX protease family)
VSSTSAVVLLIMVAVRLWTGLGPGWAQPVTGPAAAALLIAISGLPAGDAGLTLSGFWYGVSGAVLVAIGYAVAVRVPATRRLFRTGYPRPWFTALVSVPLATVVFEEVAFRGVLWGLLEQEHGPLWATGVTAVLFGLWHLGPGRPWTDAVVTGLAGVVLGALRLLGGGLAAPVLVHWAADGLGVLAAARVTKEVDQWGGTQSGAG